MEKEVKSVANVTRKDVTEFLALAARISVLNGFATDLALTFDWIVIKATADPGLYTGPILSIKAGYRLTVASDEWHPDTKGAPSLPAIRYAPYGFFLTLGIGGGSFRHS